MPFSGPKWPTCYEHIFLVQTIIITFTYLLALFIVQNLKKNSYSRYRVMRMCHFWSENGPYSPNNFFFFRKKLLISFSSSYWPLSLCKFFKKLLQLIQSYEDVPFLGPKWPIFPNENSFRKPVNKPCSFHSCLSISQKSKSDINVLMKYWQLKNTEISLAEIHFWL